MKINKVFNNQLISPFGNNEATSKLRFIKHVRESLDSELVYLCQINHLLLAIGYLHLDQLTAAYNFVILYSNLLYLNIGLITLTLNTLTMRRMVRLPMLCCINLFTLDFERFTNYATRRYAGDNIKTLSV